MEKKKTCILPCNGLDKSLGVIARSVALKLIEKRPEIQLICPVLLNTGDEKYENFIKSTKVIVIDGCMTRCASKLVEKREKKPFKRIFIPDMSKKYKIKPSKELTLNEENEKLAEQIMEEISEELGKVEVKQVLKSREFEILDFFEITVDKYYFKVPKEGYYFNENDCWIKPEGKTALLGISDYLQNAAADILFVEFPEIGSEIEQFDDAGSFESSKTVLQLISPGTGKITRVNKTLENNPELMNQDPYQRGWFIEIELRDFEEDKDLLMNGPDYFEYMKEKIMKEKNHIDQIKSEKIV
ncbi:MAG TPA: putative zinc-binding protein [Candidatus Nanopelagicaceae bacterium]|nr:putative zinc-binding protein [Candidatus Nanopelagicaceae bacterium]